MTAFAEFSPKSPLVLVGAGKMGGALLDGWLDRGLDPLDGDKPTDGLEFARQRKDQSECVLGA